MRFSSSSIWAGISVAARAVSSIAINKIFARYFLPADFAILAHFQNLINIVLIVPSEGVNKGVIKYLGSSEENGKAKLSFLKAGIILNLVVFVLSLIALVYYQSYLIGYFSSGVMSTTWIITVAVLLLLHLLNLLFLSIILAQQSVITHVVLQVVSALSSILIVYYVSKNFGLGWSLISIGFSQALVFCIAGYIALKEINVKQLFIATTGKEQYRQLAGYVLMAISLLVFGRIVEFIVRQYSINTFQSYQTGLWQAVVKFSDYYTVAFTSIVSIAFYPKASAIADKMEELKHFVKEVLLFCIPACLLGLVCVYLLRYYIIIYFFDKEFEPAVPLFKFLVIGDFFKLLSMVFGYLLIAQARTWLFIILQAGSACLYISLVYYFTPQFGLQGFMLAHLFRFIVYALVLLFIYRKLFTK